MIREQVNDIAYEAKRALENAELKSREAQAQLQLAPDMRELRAAFHATNDVIEQAQVALRLIENARGLLT